MNISQFDHPIHMHGHSSGDGGMFTVVTNVS